jgi:exonuclease SbcD
VGNAGENIEDEIIVINDRDGNPAAIVCAAPYLRERDISRFTEGETYSDRSKRISENIKKHYKKLAEIAEEKRNNLGVKIPVIATGHLSVAGGKTTEDDGVRETYIGNIACVGNEILPAVFDYVALGHYHIPAAIRENVRYCGSPLPMGFDEAEQKKSVCLVNFDGNIPKITTLAIPVFQKMVSVKGDKMTIKNRLLELEKSGSSVWVEIIYTGDDVFPDFTTWANDMTDNTKIEIIKLQNRQYYNEVFTQNDSTQPLYELNKFDVFDILLDKNKISDEQKTELENLYSEIISELSIEGYF